MVSSLIAAPALGLTHLYGLAHLGFGIPVAQLWTPFAMLSIPVLLFGPLMYRAEKLAAGNTALIVKRRLPVVSIVGWSIISLEIHYSAQLGVIEPEAEVPVLIICTLGVAVASWGVYQLRKKIEGF